MVREIINVEHDFINWPHSWSRQTHGKRAFAFDAFISHATGDKSSAIVEELRGLGVSVWHDESQEMGDAQWSMRLIGALIRSRYVVLVTDDEHDVLEREWVTAEWQSALEAERLSGVQRLVIAKWTAARVPPELSKHPQFDVPGQLEALAKMLKEGNQLPDYVILNNDPPSLPQIYDSLWEAALREAGESETRELYELICEGLDELNISSSDAAVQGLEALAITGHYESRANACFRLRALARKGCVAAGEALRRVLRRQDHDHVLELVYRWFVNEGEMLPPLTREDHTRILLVLPTKATELVDRASELAPPEAEAAKLRHAVFRSTAKHFKKLKPVSKRHEAERRFQTLLDTQASASTWEVFFRGLVMDAKLEAPFVDLASPPPGQCLDTFLAAAERFADEGRRQLGSRMWHMRYENAILQPLAMAHAYNLFGERPLLVYRKFLEALGTPVGEDLKLIEEWQRDQLAEEDAQFASLLREELESRLAFIGFYLEGPHIERRDDGLIKVDLLNSTRRVEIMMTGNKLHRARTFLEGEKQPLARFKGYVSGGGSKHPTVVAIWDRWNKVPLI